MSRKAAGAAAALVLYAALAVLFTWPLVLHPASRLLDDGNLDAFQFVWNLWWVREALLHRHATPFHTTTLFYPDGVGLFWHTLSATTGLLSLPFALAPGGMRAAVLAENATSLAALPATCILAALFVRELTGRPGVGVVAAVALVASPFYVRQLHIAYLSNLYWPLAVLLLWWRLHARPSWPRAAAVLLVFVLVFFASQDYAVMTFTLLGFDLAYRLVRRPGRPARGPVWTTGGLAVLGLALAVVAAAVLAFGGTPPERPPFAWVVWNSAYLSGFVTPPWLAAGTVPYFGSSLYLGSVPLLLALVAQVVAPRAATRWNLAALLCLVVALGPTLQLGPPTDLNRTATAPGWPLPYRLAYEIVPGVAMFRVPWRWVGAARLCCVLAGASGLSVLARGRRAIVAWGALLIVASVAEALPHRLLLVPAALPAGYGVVRDDPGAYAILDLPSGVRAGSFGLFSSLYMAYQTGHGRPLAEGTVARLPIGRRYVFEQDDYRLATHPELKYVIVHRGMFPSVYPREPSERLLAEARAAGDLVFADAETEVYRLRTYSPSRGETSRGAAQPARSASGAAPGGPVVRSTSSTVSPAHGERSTATSCQRRSVARS